MNQKQKFHVNGRLRNLRVCKRLLENMNTQNLTHLGSARMNLPTLVAPRSALNFTHSVPRCKRNGVQMKFNTSLRGKDLLTVTILG